MYSLEFGVMPMKRCFQFIMSSRRPCHRGGPNQWRRGYSDRRGNGQFVAGDSQFQYAIRSSYEENHTQYRPQTRQPSLDPNSPPYYPNQQFRPPAFYPNQPSRPPPIQQNHQFRQRTKPPDHRNWEHAKPGPPLHSERFTVLSYNILADYLAISHRSKLYYHIPRHILDWEYRKKSILFELGLWSADILCFQEVDRFQDLEVDLKIRGYNGIWKMRTGDPEDGCAIFWRASRFKLLQEESIEFSKLGLRNNVAQICVFESLYQNLNTSTSGSPASIAGNNRVVICNIHVLYNPRRGEIKLGQLRALLERAYSVSKLWNDAPVVLCGDFNFTPQSPLYSFISEQKINISKLPRDGLSGQASAEIHPQCTFRPSFTGRPTCNSAMAPAMLEPKTEIHQGENISKNGTELTRGNPTSDINKPSSSAANQIKDDVSGYSSPESHQEVNKPIESGMREDNSYDLPKVSNDLSLDKLSLNDDPFKSTKDDETPGEELDALLSEFHSADATQFPTSKPFDGGRNLYDPSAWTPMEIEMATGNSESTLVEHPLKLISSYSQVEDPSGTRDSRGEPLVTSYNRCFSGTVDYIWFSGGLETVRVLGPIPKHAMQWTPGFPTKKWGSDHIALVSELAFTKEVTVEN